MKIPLQYKDEFDVSLWNSFVLALGLVVGGYLFILPLIQQTLIGRVLIKSAWIGQMIALMGTWSWVIIILKAIRLRRQKKCIEEELLPYHIHQRITVENVGMFIRYLQSRFRGSCIQTMTKRLEFALERVIYGHTASDILEDMQIQSQFDADELDSSYSMLRTFVWAIPILGFIGTVLGIGQAIGGFAESLQSAENITTIKSTLSYVVTGLAFAFDTTFLGLLVSLLVMFPMSIVYKKEQSFLTLVNDSLVQNLGRRLESVSPALPAVNDAGPIRINST